MIRTSPIAQALAVAVLLADGSARAATAAPPRLPRTAIVVGATAPATGRAALRHAHRDAEAIRDALVSVGGFEDGRVYVLRDPEPEALLALVRREAAALAGVPQGLLFFYFSGHADGGALYSAGKAVPVEALRAALDRPEVSLRVGVLDACQGGGWTRAKGLVPDAPFEVTLPQLLASEGSALIASSSGSESAHESDALGGSFFTHHFVAAMRGAADESRRGEVTLTAAFEYARQQTIRETARRAAEPQHPSFAINLRGRQDLILAQVTASPSVLAVDQDAGPIELVHLGTGVRLLELPAGRRQVTVAVPPGAYLVRKVGASGVLAREVEVPPTGSANVSEHDLVLVASERLVVKGVDAPGMPSAWPAARGGEFGVGAQTWRETDFQYWSVGTGDRLGAGAGVRFDGRYGITDRLAWKIGTAALAYRLGERGGVEVAPYAGLLGWQAPVQRAYQRQFEWDHRGAGEVRLGGGVGVRAPSSVGAMVVTLGFDRTRIDDSWASRFGGAVGLSLAFGEALTFHVAAAYLQHDEPASRGADIYLGSVQDFGLESLPLVRIRPWGTWALDLFASGGGYTRVSYRLGVSRRF